VRQSVGEALERRAEARGLGRRAPGRPPPPGTDPSGPGCPSRAGLTAGSAEMLPSRRQAGEPSARSDEDEDEDVEPDRVVVPGCRGRGAAAADGASGRSVRERSARTSRLQQPAAAMPVERAREEETSEHQEVHDPGEVLDRPEAGGDHHAEAGHREDAIAIAPISSKSHRSRAQAEIQISGKRSRHWTMRDRPETVFANTVTHRGIARSAASGSGRTRGRAPSRARHIVLKRSPFRTGPAAGCLYRPALLARASRTGADHDQPQERRAKVRRAARAPLEARQLADHHRVDRADHAATACGLRAVRSTKTSSRVGG